MSDTADFFDSEQPVSDPLRDELIRMIRSRDAATPRHLQVELGPSDVSHPCMRRMAYGIMAAPGGNPSFDPLPSIIGTAVHHWLDSAAQHANEVLGRERWLTETRVEVTPGLSGSCDLFDCDTGTVIDWKVVGTPRLRSYRKDPGPVYKSQVHLYARGIENAGHQVKRVAIAFVPRGATLHSLHVWSQDYDPAVTDAVLARREQVICLLNDFQVDINPDRYSWFPVETVDCTFCSWYSPDPSGPLQCKGDGS
jgi:hypothetical protein